ncbi:MULTISPECIES: hypothetical protein [unclassified Micromonospora]|uniref:hypothetical protein n=1 Tax=unclassified Micromonospora TaxID=2617518 RepID=UPI002FF33FAE
MSGDLYDLLAKQPSEPVDSNKPNGAGHDDPPPNTIFTASIETIDNDRATYLLGNVSL